MEEKGLITSIQRFSVNDGPGIRTNVFLKGCPLHCEWCHNPECISPHLQIYWKRMLCEQCGLCLSVCPQDAINPPIPVDEARSDESTYHKIIREKCNNCMKCVEVCPYEALSVAGKYVTVAEVIDEVERDALFYANSGGGMTVSGGEPTVQPGFVRELLKQARGKGIHTCLDTSGHCSWDVLEDLMEYVDMFLYDLKHLDPAEHKRKTGVGNELILENLKKLSAAKKDIRIRIPLIPGYNDHPEYMKSVALFLKDLPYPVNGIDLLPFHNWCQDKYRWLGIKWSLEDLEATDPAEVEPLKDLLDAYGFNTTIGG